VKPATQITVYGGAGGADSQTGEIGGNKILLETGERTWFLDFGTSFARWGYFFDEYLKPREALGLKDHLRLGLLPPLEGIYRDDLAPEPHDLWQPYRRLPLNRRLDHVDGVLLSHAHQDHSGAIGYLKPEIPVFTGLMTAVINKGLQDLGRGEASYVAPKERTSDRALKTVKGARIGRPVGLCESDAATGRALAALQPFLSSHPGSRTHLAAARIAPAPLEALGLRFFRVDHSIPGSGAFAVRSGIGWIGYTGDLRRHGFSRARTERFARELAALKPALLIAEGTALGDRPAIEEPAVEEAARDVVLAEPGLVIADFSARNIERLRTFWDIARQAGRRLVVTPEDAYLLRAMHLVDPEIPSPGDEGLAILQAPKAGMRSWEREVLATVEPHLVGAAAIRRAPGDFLLCLSYWDLGILVDLEPQGGTYIYSASEARDEEQRFDQDRLAHWLDYFGLRKVGGLPGAEKGPYHSSGHIDGPGMEWVIETIAPEKILPVHTQQVGWFEARWPEKVVRAGYGKTLRFD
jgi:ribonuclease J